MTDEAPKVPRPSAFARTPPHGSALKTKEPTVTAGRPSAEPTGTAVRASATLTLQAFPSPDFDELEPAAGGSGSTSGGDHEPTQPLVDFAHVPDATDEADRISLLGVEERPAAIHLQETDLTADWLARAEWFEQHAAKQQDHKLRARTLVVASELWAMAGNLQQAHKTADLAAKLSPSIGQRQARQIAERLGNHTAVCVALNAESVATSDPAAKAHACFYAAEVARLKLNDTSAALKSWDQGARHAPNDPRPALFKLSKQLSSSARPPSVRWSADGGATSALADAVETLATIRAESPKLPDDHPSALASFVVASKAMSRGDRSAAAQALLELAAAPGFSRPARWLASSLLAQAAATRPQAAFVLTALLNEKVSAPLRRVLAARALELGDAAAARLALEQDRADDDADLAFTVSDHIAVGTLCEVPAELLGPKLEDTRQQDELAPLSWAVASALGLPSRAHFLLGSPEAEQLHLGDALGSKGPFAELSVPTTKGAAGRRAPPAENPLWRLMRLEAARDAGDVVRLSQAFVEGASNEAQDAELVARAHYAAGLLRERMGDTATADEHYGRALRSVHFGQAAARAMLGRIPAERGSRLLETLARSATDPERRGLLLLEAALLRPPGPERQALAQQARQADPSSPLPALIGQWSAVATKDAKLRGDWLQVFEEEARSPLDKALVALEAVILLEDADERVARLTEAWSLWPKDVALAAAMERARPGEDAHTRALRREQLAELQADPVVAAQLLLEAAWLYESCHATERAASCAERAMPRQVLASYSLYRTAPRHPQAFSVRKQLLDQIGTATQPAVAAELYQRLADFEARDGRHLERLQALEQAVGHAPSSISLLAELEAAASAQGAQPALLNAVSRLSALLPAEDAVAPALLAARLERLENGWSAAYPMLEPASQGLETTSYAARQLLAHARALGDHAVAYEMTLVLAARATEPLDTAILLVRGAELALIMGRKAEALDSLRRAIEIHPRYLPALSAYAETLDDAEHWGRAAQAYEALAQHSGVAAHQVEHWYRAAQRWLDRLGDEERALHCLERAHEIDPTHPEAFEQLRSLYERRQAFDKLRATLERRIEFTKERDELSRLQLLRARALTASGNSAAARAALLTVIRSSPENVEALTSLADLAERDGDALNAEHALLQLVRLSTDPSVQATVYARLAELYQGALQNPKRALRCYQEVLRRRPDDSEAFDAMLSVYVDAGQTERAIEELEKKQSQIKSEDQQIDLQLRLAELMALDPDYTAATEQTYANMLTRWPGVPRVVDATARYYVNTDREQYVRDWSSKLLEQSRLAFAESNYDPAPARIVEVLADVLEDPALGQLMHSVHHFLEGTPKPFRGASGAAMSRHLDDLLTPNGVSSALRILLVQTRGILDQALELNLGPLAPRRAASERVRLAFEPKARAMAISMPELFTTSVEPTMVLVTGNPSRVVLGSYWLDDAPRSALDFIAWRCLKTDQARVGLFTQLDPGRLRTVLLAFLSCFVEVRVPMPDAALFDTTRKRIAQRMNISLDDDLPVLALEVLTQLREAEPDLSDAVCRWVNRSALLASGDLDAALLALEVLTEGQPVVKQGRSVQSFLQTPQARDLLSTMCEPAFVQAYRKCQQ